MGHYKPIGEILFKKAWDKTTKNKQWILLKAPKHIPYEVAKNNNFKHFVLQLRDDFS